MEGTFIGSIVFEFIGVLFKWIFYYLRGKIKGNKVYKFKEVWNGRKNKNFKEELEYGVSNIVLGMVIIIVVIIIIKTLI